MKKQILFTVTGPAGVGKTTLVKKLVDKIPNLKQIVSYTTRKRREGEVHNMDYCFINDELFDALEKDGSLTAVTVSEVNGCKYGIDKDYLVSELVKCPCICIVDSIESLDLNENNVEVFSMLLLHPSVKSMKRNLEKRGDNKAVGPSIKEASNMLSLWHRFHHIFVVLNEEFALLALKCAISHILSIYEK